MAYNIYTTEALILSYRPLREADRVYSILTRDLGFIRATATGVRKQESKLRAGLEPISLSSVSLVRGKEYWRVTSAVLEKSLSRELDNRKPILKSLSKVFSLLSSLVQGEQIHPELFDSMISAVSFSFKDKFKIEDTEILEILLVSRTLFHLGYLSKSDLPEEIINGEVNEKIFEEIRANKKSIVKAINNGIEASNLTSRK